MTDGTPALHADWDGPPPPGGRTVVLLHGFTGDGSTWDEVRPALRALGSTLAVDLVGHGASPAPRAVAPYRMAACLKQLEVLLARLGIDAAWWLGYSMGGRVALQMATHKPHRVTGLVLESATPGLEEQVERDARVQADVALAESIARDGLETFVDRWSALPLFAGLQRLPEARRAALRAQRLRSDPVGLANSLRGMGTGAMPSVWGRLGKLHIPALLLAGADDAKFADIAGRMAERLPAATLRLIPGAGHNVHTEAPGAFLAAVTTFFEHQ